MRVSPNRLFQTILNDGGHNRSYLEGGTCQVDCHPPPYHIYRYSIVLIRLAGLGEGDLQSALRTPLRWVKVPYWKDFQTVAPRKKARPQEKHKGQKQLHAVTLARINNSTTSGLDA
jgi:hypothetical protein